MFPKIKYWFAITGFCTFSILSISAADISGYAFTTLVQDTEWTNDDERIAINLDESRNNFSLRGQISTQDKQPRRLALEYSCPVNQTDFLVWQVGRYVRLDGFYNNVTDSPSSSGISILPMATYNRRMFTGTFTIMDGISLSYTKNNKNNILDSGLRFGKPYVDSDADLQKEAFNQYSPNLSFISRFNNYGVWGKYTTTNKTFLFSFNRYAINTKNKDIGDGLATYINTNAERIDFDSWKLGFTYDINKNITFTTEYHYGNAKTFGVKKNRTSQIKSHGIYFMPTYHYCDMIDIYVSYSIARKEIHEDAIHDFAAGWTRDNGKYMMNIEYHTGEAKNGAWIRYDALKEKTDWSSFVVSAAYRF